MDFEPYEYFTGETPVLLELPHGGHLTPMEVKPYLHPKFTPGDRREDADEFSDALYLNLPIHPHALRFTVWRAHADPNRRTDDLDADGVVKTHTSQGVKIYQSDRGLPATIRQIVIDKYIRPHQDKLTQLITSPAIEKLIFCHTMPGIGTRVSADKGTLRPLFMFGNGGNAEGVPGHRAFAGKKLLLRLSEVIEDNIHAFDVDFNFCDVIRFNDPYDGSNSLNRFTPEELHGKHAFSIEINRDLVLHNPENIDPVRTIVNQLIGVVRDWS